MNPLPPNVKTALKLSLGFWILGALLVTPFMLFGLDVTWGIKAALIINPAIIFFLSRMYLRKINPKSGISAGLLFGLLLLLTHLPADFVFMSLLFKKGPILFKAYSGVLFYGEMVVFSIIAGFFKIRNKAKLV